MPWALMWKFRKYIAIALAIATVIGMLVHILNAHDDRVAAEAVHTDRLLQIRDEVGRTDEIIASYDKLIDSLQKEKAKSEPKKVEVRKYAEKLVAIQQMEQSEIDSLVATIRDSAIKVVVDSVDLAYKSVIRNMSEQVASANALREMAESDVKNRDEIIKNMTSRSTALEQINKDLLETLNLPYHNPPKPKESVGHFVVHKLIPAAVIFTAGRKL